MQNASNVPAGTFWQTGAASKAPKVAAGTPPVHGEDTFPQEHIAWVPEPTKSLGSPANNLLQLTASYGRGELTKCSCRSTSSRTGAVAQWGCGSYESAKCSCRNIVENFIECHMLFRDRFERDLPLLPARIY